MNNSDIAGEEGYLLRTDPHRLTADQRSLMPWEWHTLGQRPLYAVVHLYKFRIIVDF